MTLVQTPPSKKRCLVYCGVRCNCEKRGSGFLFNYPDTPLTFPVREFADTQSVFDVLAKEFNLPKPKKS